MTVKKQTQTNPIRHEVSPRFACLAVALAKADSGVQNFTETKRSANYENCTNEPNFKSHPEEIRHFDIDILIFDMTSKRTQS
jgi:hypothetical protein